MGDSDTKTYAHSRCFERELALQVGTPRVKLPDGSVHLFTPLYVRALFGFTPSFEALAEAPAMQTTPAAVTCILDVWLEPALALYGRDRHSALDDSDVRQVKAFACDMTSRAEGRDTMSRTALNLRRCLVGQARPHVGGHPDDMPPTRGDRRVGKEPSEQWIRRCPQRPGPDREAPRRGLPPLQRCVVGTSDELRLHRGARASPAGHNSPRARCSRRAAVTRAATLPAPRP